MRISDWSSDVCSSDLVRGRYRVDPQPGDIVRSPHKDETGNALAMFAAFGTTSADFAMNSIAELASVVRGQREFPRRTELNAALAFVDAGETENEIEAALLVQMAGTHAAAKIGRASCRERVCKYG